jgi:rhodanese-related sulfurtransferase
MVARELATMGYTNVREFKGGLPDWKNGGLPLETESRSANRAA